MIGSLNQLLNITLPSNTIPEPALRKVAMLMEEKGRLDLAKILKGSMGSWSNTSNRWTMWNADQIEAERRYSGKWTKRFESFIYKEYNLKIGADLISEIGGILGQYQKEENHFLQITQKFHWKAGSFMENSDSCWWGTFNYVRLGLSVDPNAYSVLLYRNQKEFEQDDNKGIGRCWMLRESDRYFIFNAYGVGLSVIADLLSKHFELENKRVEIASKDAWLNKGNLNNEGREGGANGIAYLLGKNLSSGKSFTIAPFANNTIVCSDCGHMAQAQEKRHVEYNGKLYCMECAEKRVVKCIFCGRKHETETTKYRFDEGNNCQVPMCPSCEENEIRNKAARTCVVHGDTLRPCKKVWHTSKYYCQACERDGKINTCYTCTHVIEEYAELDLKRNGKIYMCKPCAKKARKSLMEFKNG